MIFIVATLLVLFIASLVAFLLELRKSKKFKAIMKERTRRNKKIQKAFGDLFQNIHAFVLLVDNNLNVLETNYYQLTGLNDDGKTKRIGDMLCCNNAILSGKRGTHDKCRNCLVNNTVTQAFKKRQGFSEIRTSLLLCKNPSDYAELDAMVSGSYLKIDNEERMVITIHDITEIVSSKREVERLANVVTFTSALSRVGFASLNLMTNEEIITPEYNYNLNEKRGTPTREIFENFHTVNPDHRDILLTFIKKAKEGHVDPVQEEIEVSGEDNTTKWIKIFLMQKEYHPGKNVNDIYSLTMDITGQKEIEGLLTTSKEKAENADRSKSAFLANMSHEIRTPLNAIVGFSELLANTNSTEEKEQYLEILKMNNDMLLQLVNDILDISKIEAGTLEFHLTDVDINVLMADLERLFRMKLGDKDKLVKIVYEPAMAKCVISTDRNRIGQVLSNFLSNAIKFTETGTIHMGYKLYDRNVYFYVSDTGLGIKKDKLDDVFGRFTRFHKEKKGNGLGLSISKTIIEKLGGSIGVESVYQKGSTFWFTLPDKEYDPVEIEEEDEAIIEEIDEQPIEAVIKIETGTTVNADMSKVSGPVILIAEDNDELYNIIHATLGNKYQLHRAHTGEEAIMHFFQTPPALILMSLKLPEVDGYQATEAIRQMNKRLPIVAMSDTGVENKSEIMSNGFIDVIVKPVSKEILVDTVTRFVK